MPLLITVRCRRDPAEPEYSKYSEPRRPTSAPTNTTYLSSSWSDSKEEPLPDISATKPWGRSSKTICSTSLSRGLCWGMTKLVPPTYSTINNTNSMNPITTTHHKKYHPLKNWSLSETTNPARLLLKKTFLVNRYLSLLTASLFVRREPKTNWWRKPSGTYEATIEIRSPIRYHKTCRSLKNR